MLDISLAEFVSKYMKNSEGTYIERKEPQIIHYRNYDMAKDYNEYKREMVTLHLRFRNKEREILSEMIFITIYDENKDLIFQRRKKFESDFDIQHVLTFPPVNSNIFKYLQHSGQSALAFFNQ